MINQELLDYIKQQIERGTDREQIKSSLMANDWQSQDVEEAFSFMSKSASQLEPVSLPTQTQSISLPLQSAMEIFSQAWDIYRQRIWTFLGITAIPMLIMVVLLAILAAGGDLVIMILSSTFATGGIILLILLLILFFVAISISQVWGQTALLYAIKDNEERIGIMEAYQRGRSKIFSYWWVLLLAGFITLGGFLLLIVPGIIFQIWFSLAIFILINEDLKGINALLKSREYVKGKWVSVFWRLFFINALSLIISGIPILIFIFLKIPLDPLISRFILGIFLTPFVMTYSFLVYKNLRDLKDEITFAPSGNEKITFIFISILGILLTIFCAWIAYNNYPIFQSKIFSLL